MALPNSLDSTAPAGSASPSLGDDQFRSKTLAILDILGIPDATSITQAAFDIDAGGLAQVIFYDAAVTPATGELGRSGSTLYYRITGSHTATVLDVLGLIGDTSGAPAASIGTSILLQSESADEAPSDILRLAGIFTDVGAGSEDSVFAVQLRVAGRALDEKYRFVSTAGDGFTAIFTHAVTADRTYTLPDATGTVGLSTVVRKTADNVAVNNSTALINDTHLLYALAANQAVQFTAMIHHVGNGTADFKIAFTVPAGATLAWNALGYVPDAAGSVSAPDLITASGTAMELSGSTAIRTVTVAGIVVNGANAGNLQLQWAQVTATVVNTIVVANSWLHAETIA